MRIIWVRHGESVANQEGRFSSTPPGAPLSDLGQRQAAMAAGIVSPTTALAVYASPFLRTRQTADPIALALGVPVTVELDLREVNLGAWDGRKLSEIHENDGSAFAAWGRDPEANPPPGGESIGSVWHRVNALIARWAERHGNGTVIAVTHADVIAAVLLSALGVPLSVRHRLPIPNACILMTGATAVGDLSVLGFAGPGTMLPAI